VGDASYLSETSSKTRRPAWPNLTVGLEAIYHYLPLGLVLPELTEELLLLGVVLTNHLQASLYSTLYIVWIKCQPEVEDLPIVAVIVPDCRPAAQSEMHPILLRLSLDRP
jgi:hypothetical protein